MSPTGPARLAAPASIAVLMLAAVAGCGGRSATDRRAGPASTSIDTTAGSASVASAAMTAAPLIERVRWTSTVKGPQLQVYPTAAGRNDQSEGGVGRAWGEVLALAPTAASPGMYDQFRCHWEFARLVQPDKPSWNLEPWRPAVGYQATVAASCNPGGSEG